RHLLQTLLRFADVGEGVLGQGDVVPAVALHMTVYGEEVLAFYVRWEEVDVEFLGERQDAILGRTDPLSADLDYNTIGQCVVEDAPADSIAGFQNHHRKPRGPKVARGDQPGQSCPHHSDICLTVGKANVLHTSPLLLVVLPAFP